MIEVGSGLPSDEVDLSVTLLDELREDLTAIIDRLTCCLGEGEWDAGDT